MDKTILNKKNVSKRVAYSFAEVADMVGRHRAWVYRQVKEGRIKSITGLGSAMISVVEIERVFGVTLEGGQNYEKI